jgi:transposase
MVIGYFWLSDGQWEKIDPLLPLYVRGKRRVDDRRVISGIIQVIISGCRWSDAPLEYGPRKTLYNRFVRWAVRGIWERVFEELARAGGPPAEALLDSTHIKVHRSASAGRRKSDCLVCQPSFRLFMIWHGLRCLKAGALRPRLRRLRP